MRRLLLLATTLLLASLLAPAAHASRTQGLTFEAPRDLISADTRPAALDTIESLGAHKLRVILYWRSVAPAPDASSRPDFSETDPGAYNWGDYDALISAARARGMSILLTVSGPVPRWATRGARDDRTYPNSAMFGRFVTAVGRHYGGDVAQVSIWNEPNQPQFLLPQFVKGKGAVSGTTYRRLFLAAYQGMRAAGRGSVPLLMGETSPRGTGKVVAPLTFLRQALCLSSSYVKRRGCANLPADGYAHHAYTTKAGPFFHPPGPNDVTIGVLSRLTRALDRAGAAGGVRRGLPIFLTEFGIQSSPDKLLGVSLAQQAEYQAISEHLAWSNPRVASFSQYLLRDDEPTPKADGGGFGGFESGLEFASGAPKPSLNGFRLPLAVTRSGSGVSIWGHVRPARSATTATLQVADRGKAFRTLKTVKTDSRRYFTTRSTNRSGRRWRLRWRSSTGAPIRAYRPA